MRETKKVPISTYTMKMRLYPSEAQKEAMDKILHALHVAYNITFYEVFQKNPEVCSKPNQEGKVWPDYEKMVNAKWREALIQENPVVADAPATSLMNPQGLFQRDGKRAWETGMRNRPVDPEQREDFQFYNAKKERRSFFVQVTAQNLVPHEKNGKVAWITIPKVEGRIKARGFNRKLWFGEAGQHTYAEALQNQELPRALSVRVSKDKCGDYFVCVTFFAGKKGNRSLFLEMPQEVQKEAVGIDVGVKNVATLSTGQEIENRHFKKQHQKTLNRQNRALSRRWGPMNVEYRDYNRNVREDNRNNLQEQHEQLSAPSNRYVKLKQRKARLERKIARQRDTYYHQETARLVQQSNFIAIETLYISNMLKNHRLAYALSDAAMSDFMEKLEYKAERCGVPVCPIGTFEPTSQLCSNCGEQNPRLKNLNIRKWTCPHCRTHHNRDINAAINILKIATEKGGILEKKPKGTETNKRSNKQKRKTIYEFVEYPNLKVEFSKELTTFKNPRYVIKDKTTGDILDDAQGFGYKTVTRAKNCYKAKFRRAKASAER